MDDDGKKEEDNNGGDNEGAASTVLHVLVVGFHHKKGCNPQPSCPSQPDSTPEPQVPFSRKLHFAFN